MNLPRLALDRPVTTAMTIVGALALGLLSTQRLPLEYLPEMAWPSATVSAAYQGSSPEEVDRLIARPLEDRLATLPRLESLSSTSTNNGASIRVEFGWDVDMDLMSLEIRERLELARPDLPDDMQRPRLMRFSTADFSVVHLSVAWDGHRDELEDVVENRVVPALQRLDGVANVEVHGLTGKRVLVEIDRDLLETHGVDPFEVVSAIRAANRNVSIGSVERGGREFFVRAVGEFESLDEIATLPLTAGGLTVGDVARVDMGFPTQERVQLLDGSPAVTIEVYKSTRANMVDVARDTRSVVATLTATPGLEDLRIRVVRDRSREVLRSLGKLRDAGTWGGLLAAIVLLLFLRQVRSTVIVLVSIPTSVMVTLAVMFVLRQGGLSNITLNVVSLTGLMLAVGMLVDNAVVVMENIYRERRAGLSAREAALKGATDVLPAVVAATLTTVVVFASILGNPADRFGRWLSEFGLAMTIALLSSLVVALTLVPMAAGRLFRKDVRESRNELRTLGRLYQGTLGFALRWRWLALVASGLLVWGSWKLLATVDRRPAPRTEERRVTIDVRAGHSYTMEQFAEVFARLESTLAPHREELEVEAIVSRYGVSRRRAWEARADMQLYLSEGESARRTTTEIKEAVRELLPVIPGVEFRLERVRHWSGDQDVSVELSARDGALLAAVAEDVRDRMVRVGGLKDVETNLESGDEELRLVVDRTRAAERGVTPLAVARAVGSSLGERPVTRFRTNEREIDILLRFPEEQRTSLEDVRQVEIRGSEGLLTLGTIASFERGPGPRLLRRQDRKQTITVAGEPAEGNFFFASRGVESLMSQSPLPAGVSWQMGRTFRWFRESQAGTFTALWLALALVYLVMASLFESLVHPLTILVSVPFALTGVAVLFWATETPLDNMAYLGFMVLAGLVVNNGILLVDTTNRLRRGQGLSQRDALLEAGRLRLRPILITTVTTLVGLFPLVAPGVAPGIFGTVEGRSAQWTPVAMAVFGGLLASTPLTLGVTPVVYSLIDDLGTWLRRSWQGSAAR